MYTNKKSWVYINISYSGISNCKKIVKFCGSSSQQSHKVHFPASYSFPRLFSRPASVSHSVACLWVNLAEGLPTTLGLGLITGHSLPWWLLWSWSCCRYQPSTQVPLLVYLGCPGWSLPPEISKHSAPRLLPWYLLADRCSWEHTRARWHGIWIFLRFAHRTLM